MTVIIGMPGLSVSEMLELMRECVELYSEDLRSWDSLPLGAVFARVALIPYRMDEAIRKKKEFVGRPLEILRLPALDCKKKSILIASWAQNRGIPWEFVAVDYDGRGYSHVYTVVYISGRSVTMDATIRGLAGPGWPDGARRRTYG